MKEWLLKLIEWFQSFISEPKLSGETSLKGSSKRVTAMVLVLSFLWEYHALSNAVRHRIVNMPDDMVSTIITTDSLRLIDIPYYWVLLLAGIIGLNIVDYVVKKKKNKEDELEVRVQELEKK